jgi:hypothetical protein
LASGRAVGAPSVLEDVIDRRGRGDEGDDPHFLTAAGTGERVHLEEASQQLGPAARGFADRLGRGLD